MYATDRRIATEDPPTLAADTPRGVATRLVDQIQSLAVSRLATRLEAPSRWATHHGAPQQGRRQVHPLHRAKAEGEDSLVVVRTLRCGLPRLSVAEQQPTLTIPGELTVNEIAIANSIGEKDVPLLHDGRPFAT
jgi:hypothetical protein